MKKFLALFMTVAMLAALCVTAFAATGEFVGSPSVKPAPGIEAKPAVDSSTVYLELTPFAERNDLDAEAKKALEEAYEDIANSEVINGVLKTEFQALATELKTDLSAFYVGELFDISEENCTDHTSHGGFTVALKPEVIENFAAIIHCHEGTWEVVKSTVDKEKGTITFAADEFSPFAIVYSGKSVETGDFSTAWIYVVLMTVSLAALGFTGYKLSKKNN